MPEQKRITVRGEPRTDIDPFAFLQTLLAIGEELTNGSALADLPIDAFDTAMEAPRQGGGRAS